jgi:hypothetical protein
MRTVTCVILVGAATVLGCGKSTGSIQLDAGFDSRIPVGSLVAACPPSIPEGGSPCPEPGQIDCEYGDDWNAQCNTLAQCWRGGPLNATWQLQPPYQGSDFACPTPSVLAQGCPSDAPDTETDGGAPCASVGTACPYGAVMCACTQQDSGDSATLDASYGWLCSNPGPGCPEDRYRIGSACSTAQEGMFCEYAVCGVGTATYCQGGIWLDGVLIDYCD